MFPMNTLTGYVTLVTAHGSCSWCVTLIPHPALLSNLLPLISTLSTSCWSSVGWLWTRCRVTWAQTVPGDACHAVPDDGDALSVGGSQSNILTHDADSGKLTSRNHVIGNRKMVSAQDLHTRMVLRYAILDRVVLDR